MLHNKERNYRSIHVLFLLFHHHHSIHHHHSNVQYTPNQLIRSSVAVRPLVRLECYLLFIDLCSMKFINRLKNRERAKFSLSRLAPRYALPWVPLQVDRWVQPITDSLASASISILPGSVGWVSVRDVSDDMTQFWAQFTPQGKRVALPLLVAWKKHTY